MATVLKNLSSYDPNFVPDGSNMKIGVVTAEWNPDITFTMRDGAVETLLKHGVKEDNILLSMVPGTFELTSGAQMLLEYTDVDAVIVLGCVIQGETRHFDFICQAVTQGSIQLTTEYLTPVIFGVLTTQNLEQAKERAGGKHGNKGVEAAVTALKMIGLHNQLKPED